MTATQVSNEFAAADFTISRDASVRIGVCGEQAAGKTVFLTCVFQTIRSAFTDELVIDFDKKDVGNASYFQEIEDHLITHGPGAGTPRGILKPIRLFVRPYQVRPAAKVANLAVNLVDFAGGHFRAIADQKHADDDDVEAEKTQREVNEMMENADAFIILINVTEIDPEADAPKRNPFGPAVDGLLTYCREHRKPVGLLFSQVDRVPAFTEAVLQTLPRVRKFQRMFTSDYDEVSRVDGRPFGLVRRVSCFETVKGDLVPRGQSGDGSVWLREPAEVVMSLLQAVVPGVRDQLRREDEAERAAKEQQEEEERRERMRTWAMWAAVMLSILALLALALPSLLATGGT
jgi:hypothetical protein